MIAEREKCVSAPAWIGALVLFLAATRWALAPRYLYYFDSANFALALERFNPALHQPQPPGYPLFVLLTRVIHLLVARPEHVFLIAGLVAAFGAVILAYSLAADLFGFEAGLLAATLLASDPVFWFGGLTNQVRIFLALDALAIVWFAWRAVRRPNQPGWLYGAFAAVGVAAGFRAELPVLLLPVTGWAWLRCGARVRSLMLGLALLAATVCPWLAITVAASGGPRNYGGLLREYANSQFEGSSAVFGAAASSAWHMLCSALVWNFFGATVWLWALPLVRRMRAGPGRAMLLTLAFLPPFLFSAFIHIGDPDQALGSISILCVAGGGVLARLRTAWTGRALSLAGAGLTAAHCLLFFCPPGGLARAASYRTVAAVSRMTAGAIETIRDLRRDGPITVVHYGSMVASRQLSWYFPEDYVVVLPECQVFFRHQALSKPRDAAGLLRPGSHRIVCLLPFHATGHELPGWRKQGPVYYLELGGRSEVAIGSYRVVRRPS